MSLQTNLNEITDVKELKSMAYDQLAAKEVAESNLQAINQRLAQVAQEEAEQSQSSTKK